MSADKKIAYASETHRQFNKRFEQPAPASSVNVSGPWMKADVLQRLPLVRSAFDLARRLSAANQSPGVDARAGTAGATGQGSETVHTDAPEPTLKPPRHMRGDADREGWLVAQRDAALARMACQETDATHTQEQDRAQSIIPRGPSR